MKSIKIFFLLLMVCSFFTESYSLPRFALRAKSQCSDCHINPTGGEMRTSRGWNTERKYLPIETTDENFKMSNKLNDNISVGLDFRGNYLVFMDSNSTKSDFQRMTGSIYTNLNVSENMNIYARYDFIWQIWEAYGVARLFNNTLYLKGGSFVPNFGIRLDDHTAYTRGGDLGRITSTGGLPNRGLIYDPRYVESGAEIGVNITDYALLTASVGNSRSPQLFATDPTYTARLQIQPDINETIGLFFGGSFASFKMEGLGANFQTIYRNTDLYGGFLGLGISNFTIMGEFDVANNYLVEGTKTNVAMVEAAYKIIRGVEAVVRYDRFDPNGNVSGDQVSRVVMGFELYPYSFIEVRPQFRLQMEDPSVRNNAFVLQMHLFY